MAIPPPLPGGYRLWPYYPSIAGAIVMTIIFFVLSLSHIWCIIKTKKNFCIALAVGGLFEVVGYIARADARYNVTSVAPYAIQSLLILLAPILFAASTYMYLGRLVTSLHGESLCMISQRFLTKIFVTGDVICFLLQSGGGGILATSKSESTWNLGQHIILGGLILQILLYVVFVIVAINFHIKYSRSPESCASTDLPWQRLLFHLYGISLLIVLRNIVRAIEYATGSDGYLQSHEWVMYVFDGLAMVGVLAGTLVWYRTTIGTKMMAHGTIEHYHLTELVSPRRAKV